MARARMILTVIGAFCLAFAAAGASAWAQQKQQYTSHGGEKGPHMIGNTTTASGTIRAIDKQARTVTIETSEGKQMLVDAPAEADLTRLHVGDKVELEYREALAVQMEPPSTPTAGPTESTTSQREKGATTGIREVTVTAEVVSVDPAKNQVTFRGPKGTMETITVQNPQMQERAKQLKPGDKVRFKYTQAAALTIRPKK